MPPTDNGEDTAVEESQQETRRNRFLSELLGIFMGLAVALMVSALVPQVREQYSLGLVILWGGVIGGTLASRERFERAGAIMTGSENTTLNYLVGFGTPALILLALYLFTR